MIKKLLIALGIGLATNSQNATAEFYKPYQETHVNFLYNLLFCDSLSLFKSPSEGKDDSIWATLLAEQPNMEALHKIADDEANEGRVRALGVIVKSGV